MKEKVHPTNELDRLFKEFGDTDVLVVTDDMTNQEPYKVLDTDWQTYYNLCEVIKFE